MSLRDPNLNISYGPTDDRLNEFFPVMAASKGQRRLPIGPHVVEQENLSVAVLVGSEGIQPVAKLISSLLVPESMLAP